ncbi:MAG: hypothetical protein AABW91_01690 [Nanoarchaeota archaeon]
MANNRNFEYEPGECLRVSTMNKSFVGVFEKLDRQELYLKPSLVYEPGYTFERMPDRSIRQIEEPVFREETERPIRITLGAILSTEPISRELYNKIAKTEIKTHIETPEE